jgi:hypothetical protein
LEAYSAKKSIAMKETQYEEVKNQLTVLQNYNKELLEKIEKQNLLFAEAFLNSKLQPQVKARRAKIIAEDKGNNIVKEVVEQAKAIVNSPIIEQVKEITSNLSKLKGE